MASVKKSTPLLKPTVNSKITTTAVAKSAVKPSTITKKLSEGIGTIKSTSNQKSTSQSAVSPVSTKTTMKPVITPRPLKVMVPVKQAADSTSALKVKSAVKPTGKAPSVPVKTAVAAKPISKVTMPASPIKTAVSAKPISKVTTPASPIKKLTVPADKSVKVANGESVNPKMKPAITTKVSTLKSPAPSTTPVKARSLSITSVKSSLATKTTKPVSTNKSSTPTIVKSATKVAPQLTSKSTKSIVGQKTTLKPSTAVKSVGKVASLPVTKTEKSVDEIKQQQDGALVEIRDADSTTIEEVAYVPNDTQKCDENANFKQESGVDEERVYAVAEQLIMLQQLHKDSYVINMSGIEIEETCVQTLNSTSEPNATSTEATIKELSNEEQTASLDTLAHQLPAETDTTTEEKEVMLEDEHIEENNNTDPVEDCKAMNNTPYENTQFLLSIIKEVEDVEGPAEQDIFDVEEVIGEDFLNEETNLLEESFPSSNAEMTTTLSETNISEDFPKNEETNLLEELQPIPFSAQVTENLSEISVCSAASFLDETKSENSSEMTVMDTIELEEMNVPNACIENTDKCELVLETNNNNLLRASEFKYELIDKENPSVVDTAVLEDSAKDVEESCNTVVENCLCTLLDSVCENSLNNEILPLEEISENSSLNMPESALIDFTNEGNEDNYAATVHESCNKEESTCSNFSIDSHFSATNSIIIPTDLGIFNNEQSNGSCPTVEHDKNENFMVFGNFEDVLIGMSYAEALTFPKTLEDNRLDVELIQGGVNIDYKNDIQPYPVNIQEKTNDPIGEVIISQAESSIPIYSVYDNAEFPDAVPSDEHYEKQDHEHEGDQHEETFHKIRHKRNKRRNKKNRKSSNAENFDEDSPNKVHTEKPNYQQPEYHGRRRNSRRWRNSRAYYEAFHQPQQAQYQEYYRDSHWKYSDAKMD